MVESPQTATHMVERSPGPCPHPDTLEREDFMRLVQGSVEHSPWVAQRAWQRRPFGDVAGLARAMEAEILGASRAEQLALLNAHPELAGREAAAGEMTPESTGEQGRLGLMALTPEHLLRLQALNRAYRDRFGFPLIVALRLHATLDSVFIEAQRRLSHDPATEWPAALHQVCQVMRGRLATLFPTPPPA
jgi:2-oxo-4-hydroxy-4-carboxy-5-ureidoimidazoline decarboxylase